MGSGQKNGPVHEERLGRIKAAVWENATKNGSMFNVKFSRIYHDAQSGWQESGGFGRDDCLLLARVAELVTVWIYRRQQKDEAEAA
jgi:hypothetical protein